MPIDSKPMKKLLFRGWFHFRQLHEAAASRLASQYYGTVFTLIFRTGTFNCAHHEKLCVIDETIAFVAGWWDIHDG